MAGSGFQLAITGDLESSALMARHTCGRLPPLDIRATLYCLHLKVARALNAVHLNAARALNAAVLRQRATPTG